MRHNADKHSCLLYRRYGTTVYESVTKDGRLVAIRRMKVEAFDAMEKQLCGLILNKVSHKNICDILVNNNLTFSNLFFSSSRFLEHHLVLVHGIYLGFSWL